MSGVESCIEWALEEVSRPERGMSLFRMVEGLDDASESGASLELF
jgi:hypothetical protein